MKFIPVRERNSKTAVRRRRILGDEEMVYVRHGPQGGPLKESYAGPYRVLRKARKVYELQIGSKTEKVSTDRLKAYSGSSVVPATPPRRGRPPGTGG